MSRPVTIVTGQWGDIPLEELARMMFEFVKKINFEPLRIAFDSGFEKWHCGSREPAARADLTCDPSASHPFQAKHVPIGDCPLLSPTVSKLTEYQLGCDNR